MINIQTEFLKSGMLLDKTTQPLTAFPYEYDNLKIKSNEYVIDSVINDTIKKLHYNFLYLYRGCNVGNFEVFENYLYSIKNTNVFPFFENIQDEYNLVNNTNSIFKNSRVGIILPYNFATQSSYMFAAEQNFITCIETGLDVEKFIFKTDNVDPLSGDIKFKNITDLKSDLFDNLYVIDNGYNTIYQYNVNSFVSNEFIYREKLFLKNLIGGVGGVNDNNKFNNVKSLAVGKDIIVVQDVGNKCFKIFDKNLNWINTCVFVDLFNEVGEFNGIILDKDNTLYAGSQTKIYKFNFISDLKLYEYNNTFNLINYFKNDERIVNLLNIYSNKDMFFVQTNLSLKKIWFTSLTFVLGQFDYPYSTTLVDLKWVAASVYDSGRDIVVLYNKPLGSTENLSVNIDKTYYNSLLNVEGFSIYEIDELLIDKEEYIQSWVLLSKFSKIHYNIFLLLQNIKYKYQEKTGLEFPLIDKKIYNKGFLGFIKTLDYEKNFDIGINEIFQSEVINRMIFEIYNFQLTIMLYIINNSTDKIFLSPDPYIDIPTSKRFVYFVDESFLLSPNPITLNIFEEISPGAGILKSLGGAPISSDDSISIEEGVNV